MRYALGVQLSRDEEDAINQDVMKYLHEVLDLIQCHAVKRDHINWSIFRQEIGALATKATTPAETYPAIRIALERLGDRHSRFVEPMHAHLLSQKGAVRWTGVQAFYPEGVVCVVARDSPAEKAHIQVGDKITQVNGQPIANLTIAQFSQAIGGTVIDLVLMTSPGEERSVLLEAAICPAWGTPTGRGLDQGIGYLALPSHQGTPEQDRHYAQTAQDILREIDQQPITGWVIDLRGNGGGNMWPMLAGIGPVLGEGVCEYFLLLEKKITIQYANGQARGEQPEEFADVQFPYEVKHPLPPVAVLTSRYTASAGEFVSLAFRGRPLTRILGEPTRGLPTTNESFNMSDGAWLILTTALGADRTGQVYDGPLVPDQHVPIDWSRIGADGDPVLRAAMAWLLELEG